MAKGEHACFMRTNPAPHGKEGECLHDGVASVTQPQKPGNTQALPPPSPHLPFPLLAEPFCHRTTGSLHGQRLPLMYCTSSRGTPMGKVSGKVDAILGQMLSLSSVGGTTGPKLGVLGPATERRRGLGRRTTRNRRSLLHIPGGSGAGTGAAASVAPR